MKHTMAALALVWLAMACTPSEPAATAAQYDDLEPVPTDIEAELVVWRDLLPDEDLAVIEALNEGLANPSMMTLLRNESGVEGQLGTFNVVEDLDGLIIRMPGYILPLDFAEHGASHEFLLLPYHGACVHTPPPPPNQIVFLRSAEPVRFGALWEPVWVEGRMEVERVNTDLAATAYSMVVRTVEPYQVR